jgi:two-component system OmpR family sensor kinase
MFSSVPIQWRLTLFNALAIGVILMVLGLALFFLLREALLSGTEDTVRSRALTAARTISDEGELSSDDIEQLTLDGVFVIVRDGEGRVLYQTINLVAQDENKDDLWRRVIETGAAVGEKAELSSSAPDYVYAVPVASPKSGAQVIEAGKPYEAAQETIKTFATILAIAVLAAFLVSMVGAYLLARAALAPVDAVVDSAKKITEGDLSKRLPVPSPKDKIGRLAETINGLLARLERAFARREEALARQRRFVADAGHELRTPLTSIGGYAQMLEEGGLEGKSTAREGVAAIRRESERMRELVNDLLSLARGDEDVPLELGSHDLGEVAREAAETARVSAGAKVAVEYTLPEQQVEAVFDRNRVRQVISILLDNAVKYTPKGRVTVMARGVEERVEVEVSDTGSGIPEEHLHRIFDRFYQADEARTAGGLGLGLPIARQIAEAHGGKVEAKSEPGKGSTFTLSLPKKRSASRGSSSK